MISDTVRWDGRDLSVQWEPGERLVPVEPVRQVSGVCFTASGQVVLVSENGQHWTLPGGHPEGQESPRQTLAREVAEEACAEVQRARMIGWQRVSDPYEAPYLQLRYAARVRLKDFRPQHEIRHRRLVDPGDVLTVLGWGYAATAQAMLAQARLAVLELP